MKLHSSATDEKSLTQLGREAAIYIESRDFAALAKRFGYALAYGRTCELAIREDFERCLSEAISPSNEHAASICVKYFKPNTIPLFALVECVVPINESETVLLELIVAGRDEKHISLEQICFVS